MAVPEPVDEASIAEWLAAHPAWSLEDGRLVRTLQFEAFRPAFGFMTELALVAERLNHHPEWSNVYGRVDIALTTHDAGGITALDLEVANAVDTIAGETH